MKLYAESPQEDALLPEIDALLNSMGISTLYSRSVNSFAVQGWGVMDIGDMGAGFLPQADQVAFMGEIEKEFQEYLSHAGFKKLSALLSQHFALPALPGEEAIEEEPEDEDE